MDQTGNHSDDAQRVLEIVRALFAEIHPGSNASLKESLSLDSSFERDLGFDSLARVELVLRVGQALGDALPEAVLEQAQTPRDILRYAGTAHPASESHGLTLSTGTRAAGVPHEMTSLVSVLEWHAERQPDRVHVLLSADAAGETTITYASLLSGAKQCAAGLLSRGVMAGESVALMLPTGRDYLECFFGILIAGAIPVPIYPPARLAQVEEHLQRHAKILGNAATVLMITVDKAKPVALMLRAAVTTLAGIVTAEELRDGEEVFLHKVRSDEIALLQYTSGSTGDPKGVVLTHANLLANIRAMGKATKVNGDDVFVSWLPLYHDMGLIGAWLGALYHGCPLILMPPLAFLAHPVRWLAAISRHGGTISGAPNFAYELCVRKINDAAITGLDLSHWRFAFNGAEPVNPSTLDAFARRFSPCGLKRTALAPVYGLAECSVGLTFPPSGRGPKIDIVRREPFADAKHAEPVYEADEQGDVLEFASCGHPLPGHDIRIVDDAGLELPERQVGLLQFRGPSATTGYWRNPSATAQLLHDGWLNSGDYAYAADGEIYLVGRAKDLIIRGGRNIYPYDLEEAVGNLHGIRKGCVAVFPTVDAAGRGDRLVVLAETRNPVADAEAEALRHEINAAAIDVLGIPADEIALVPPHTVLKTSSGKIRRAACRAAFERGELGRGKVPPWLQTTRLFARTALARIALIARRVSVYCYAAYFWILFALLASVASALALLMMRPSVGRKIMHSAARTFFKLSALRVSGHGLERLPRGPHVLVVNHASYLDGFVLTALLPPRHAFVAKAELRSRPAVLRVLAALGTVFVERFDVTQSDQNIAAMVAALRAGERLVIFPEGTLTRKAGVRPFGMGGFVAAVRAGVPVVVAGLRGTRAVLRDETWLPRFGVIDFEVGPTLTPQGSDWVDAVALTREARTEMLSLAREPDLAR